MAEYQIPITYVVSASAVTPSAGLEPLKLSTILLLTTETPASTISGSYMIARTASAVSNIWGTETETAAQANIIFAQQPNILANNGYLIVAPLQSTTEDETTIYETLSDAITRLSNEIYFEGILTTKEVGADEYISASNAVEAMNNRILMLPVSTTSALSGVVASVANNVKTKPVLYLSGDEPALSARLFAAAYLSRAFAVNYSGSNTTLTMNLKTLNGIPADTQISDSILAQCESAGVDCYPSIEGLAKVMSFAHAGQYFDQITNQLWFVNSVQREVFNVLATTSTKIPQTEIGLEIITKAIRTICNQAVTNGFSAPGVWNSPDTFGNIDDFYRNIEEFGFYIYHLPVTEQAQSERINRQAPVYMIAIKEAGAVHSANILIYINP